MGEIKGEFHTWSHASIFHHKAAGSLSPHATSDRCRKRLIRKRERFWSTARRWHRLLPRCKPLKRNLQLTRSARRKHAHKSPAMLRKQCITFELDSVPPSDQCVVHSSASVSSAWGVFALSSTLSQAVLSLHWQSCKVNFDGEVKTEQSLSRVGLRCTELLMGWVIYGCCKSWVFFSNKDSHF